MLSHIIAKRAWFREKVPSKSLTGRMSSAMPRAAKNTGLGIDALLHDDLYIISREIRVHFGALRDRS